MYYIECFSSLPFLSVQSDNFLNSMITTNQEKRLEFYPIVKPLYHYSCSSLEFLLLVHNNNHKHLPCPLLSVLCGGKETIQQKGIDLNQDFDAVVGKQCRLYKLTNVLLLFICFKLVKKFKRIFSLKT